MNERSFSLAALTVLELSPPEMVEVAARAGYDQVGLRLVPATPEEHHFPLVADAMDEIIRQARQARCFPGEGDIDLAGLLAVLPSDVPLSLEIPTQELRERGVSALTRARRALAASRRLLDPTC